MTFLPTATEDFEQQLMRVATFRSAVLGGDSIARKTLSANQIVGDSRAYVLHDNARSHNQGCRLFGVSNKKKKCSKTMSRMRQFDFRSQLHCA